MKNKLLKFFKNLATFFVIVTLAFSNIPFNFLTSAIGGYIKTSNIVDQAWSLSQDDNVVDNLVSSYRNKNIALLDKLAGNLKINEARAATSYVGGVTCARAGSTGTALTCSLTALTGGSNAAPSQNDIVIASVSTGSTADRAIGVTNVGYTELPELYANGTTYDTNLSVSWKIMGATPDTSVNFSASGSTADAISAVVHVWRGVDTGTPFDVTNQSITGTATGRPNPPPITPVTSGATVIAIGAGAAATGVVYTAAGLANFRTVASVDTYDSMTGMGSFAWASGTYDSAQFAGGTANAADSWASYTLALRPAVNTTTITNFVSAEPGNSTIAPNASGMVDSFGLAVNSGTDTVTAATVGLAAGMGQYIQTVSITNDGDTVTYCSAAPSVDTASLSSCTVPVTTTNTQFKIKLTAKAHASMPAPAGGSYGVTATVTGWTGTNTTHAGTDSGSSTLTIDNLSPNGATSVSGTAGNAANAINWTTSNSADFDTTNGSVVYRWVAGAAGSETPTEGATPTLGSTNGTATVACLVSSAASAAQSKTDGSGGSADCTTTALTNGQAYTYKAFQRDTNGNYDVGVLIGTFTPSAPASTLTISASAGSKVANVDSGATSQFVHDISCTTDGTCAAFKLAASGGAVNVTSITVTETNASLNADIDLANATLIYDTDANYSNGTAGTFGTDATFASQVVTFTNAGLNIPNGSTYYFYIRTDLANGTARPDGGLTMNFFIANATDVVSDGTESGTALLPGTTTIRPNVTSVTYPITSPLNGARLGQSGTTITGAGFGTTCDGTNNKVMIGSAVVNCAQMTFSDTSITINNNWTYSSGDSYGGATTLLATVGGTADDLSKDFYVYPAVSGVIDPTAYIDAAREYDAGDSDGVVTVNGNHFGTAQGSGSVTVLGQTATIVSWGATAIQIRVPITIPDSSYTGSIVVYQGTGGNSSALDTYGGGTYRILPRITSLTPNSGPNGQSTIIAGDHLCQTGTCPVDTATWNSVADDGYDVEWLTTDATVTVIPTHTSITANAPSLADGLYAVTVTTGGGTSYTSNELTFTIANNAAPTLSISAPPAGNTAVAEGSTYNVTYALADTDNVVTAAFYYETDGNGSGGTAIAGCGTLGEAGTICSFNTSVLTPGTAYYVYGVTSDGINPTVTTVSSGTITVNDAPTLSISAPPAGNTAVAEGSSYNVTYTLSDPDSTVTAAFYYETDGNGSGGTAIAGCGAKAEGTTSCSFNTSVLTPGTAYFVYGVTSGDSVNTAVTTVSSGTITVNDAPTLSVSQPDGVGDTVNTGDLYNITYTLTDPDSTVTSAFYWDTNNDGVGGTAITGACASAAEGGTTCSWDTTGMTAGSYYVYGVTSGDSVNAAVTAVSPGQITINELPQVTADSFGAQSVNLDSGATGQYIGAAFRFRQNSGTADTVTALTLSEKNASFTANTGLTSAMIRYETNMVSCTASPITTTGTLAKSGVSFNASDQAVFSTLSSNIPVTVGANYTCVYLFFDVSSSASGGKQIEMELTASSDFTLQNSTAKAGTYPALLSGTTTIRPNVTSVTYPITSPLNGARLGQSGTTITGAGFGTTCDGTNNKVMIGSAVVNCAQMTFSDTSITINNNWTYSSGDSYGGATTLLATVGGTADDLSKDFYVYPAVSGVIDPTAYIDAAREYDAGDSDGVVTVNGNHFGTAQGSGSVTVLGQTATIVSWVATAIQIRVPATISDSLYTGSIVVYQGTGGNSSALDTYGGGTYRILPRVTSLSSANGVVGDNIIVNGNHLCQTGSCPGSPFIASNNVLFGATNADAPGTWSWAHTAVNAKVPSGSGTVAVKAVSNDYDSNTTNFTYVSTAPGAPTTLQQFRSNGVTEIVVGGGTNDTPTQTKMEGDFTAETSITAFLEVEVKPKASAFDGTTNIFTSSPSTGSSFSNILVSISGLADGEYHWRARAKNQTTLETSAWVAFGSNPSGDGSGDGSPANVDFAVDTTAPTISNPCAASPTASNCTSPTPTDIQAKIIWDTNEDATQWVAYQYDSCSTGVNAEAVFNSLANKQPATASNLSSSPHSQTLSGLIPSKTYYYKIRASDAFGNVSYEPSDTTCRQFTTATAQTRVMKTLEFFIDQNTAVGGTLNKNFDVFISERTTDPSKPNNIYIKSVIIDVNGVSKNTGNFTVDVTLNGIQKTYTITDTGGNATFWKVAYDANDINYDYINNSGSSNSITVTSSATTNTLLGAKAIITYYYEPL